MRHFDTVLGRVLRRGAICACGSPLRQARTIFARSTPRTGSVRLRASRSNSARSCRLHDKTVGRLPIDPIPPNQTNERPHGEYIVNYSELTLAIASRHFGRSPESPDRLGIEEVR